VIVKAHSSAITSVKFSPLNSNMFASSSSDSTIKVWKSNQRKDNISIVYTLQQHDFWAPINDIAWSPKVATMLIAVKGDGKIDVWDVSKSVMDPVKSLQESTETEWANLLFEKDGNVIVVSDDQGDLKVFHLRH
jgi:WD40 repeat protein